MLRTTDSMMSSDYMHGL